MRFPYRRFRVKNPLISLQGRQERPRPIIGVTLIGPADSRHISALLDSGADDCLFPDSLAATLGIDLATAPTLDGAGLGMVPYSVYLAEVVLRLTAVNEQREWNAWVGFTSAKLRQPLLGFAGCLQFFSTTFDGDLEEVELTINATYPGN